MSVSTVVRNILLHTFDLVEDVVTDTTNVALSLTGDRDALPAAPRARRTATEPVTPDGADILGWQEALLNLNAVCSRCNAILARGTTAGIGIRQGSGHPAIICVPCLGALRASAAEPSRKE